MHDMYFGLKMPTLELIIIVWVRMIYWGSGARLVESTRNLKVGGNGNIRVGEG